jgi:hypothetical protein
MLSAPCPFNAPFLFSVFQLLHTASFYTPESLSTTTPSLLCSAFYTICAPSASSMHNAFCMLFNVPFLFIGLFTATPHFSLLHSSSINTLSLFCMFSSCRVLFLIIMEIPQLFWQVMPMRSSSLGVMLRFLSLSSSRDSSSSLS